MRITSELRSILEILYKVFRLVTVRRQPLGRGALHYGVRASAIWMAMAAAAGPVAAVWSTDPNVNLAVAVAPNAQLPFAVLGDAAGGSYIVWFDQRNGTASQGEFYGQRLDGNGTALWASNGIPLTPLFNTQGGGWGSCEDGAGNAIVAWSLSDGTLRAQKINGSGALQWDPNGLVVTTSISPLGFDVCGDGAGGAIFTWPVGSDIFSQRINANGVAQWGSGLAITSGASVSGNCWSVSDGGGGAIVGWNDNRAGQLDVYAQRVNAGGSPQWMAPGAPVATSSGNESLMPGIQGTGGREFIAADGSGGAFFAFAQPGPPSTLFIQRLDSSGGRHWGNGGHPLASGAVSIQTYPVVLSDGNGGVFVAWEDTRSGNPQVFAQRFNQAGGNRWTADGIAVADQVGEYPFILTDGADGVLIGFTAYTGGISDVFAQRLDPLGSRLWGNVGLAVSTAPGEQWAGLAIRGACGMIIAWRDSRADPDDAYAQAVNDNGTLGCPTTSAERAGTSDSGVRLERGFPNPFTSKTSVSYSLGDRCRIRLSVHDAQGRVVKNLIDAVQVPGSYTVSWDGSNALALPVPSGVYWAVLESEAGPRQVYRLTLVR